MYWAGECAVTTLPTANMSCDNQEVGAPCIVREGRITHTHGRLAAFGVYSFFILCGYCLLVHVQYMNVCIHTYMYLSYTGTKAEVDILQEKFSKGEWRPPFRVEEDCSDTESTPVAPRAVLMITPRTPDTDSVGSLTDSSNQ